MKKALLLVLFLSSFVTAKAYINSPTFTPSITMTKTVSPTITVTATITATPTVTGTSTPTFTITPSFTAVPIFINQTQVAIISNPTITFPTAVPQFTQIPVSAWATPIPYFTELPYATVVPWGTAIITEATKVAQLDVDVKINTGFARISDAQGNTLFGFEDGAIGTIGYWHRKQHQCVNVQYTTSGTLGPNQVKTLGIYVPASIATATVHTRIELITISGVVQAQMFCAPFGYKGATLTAISFGLCANSMVIKVYDSATNTSAAGTAVSVIESGGGSDTTGPHGGSFGNGALGSSDADWCSLTVNTSVASGNSYALILTGYSVATKFILNMYFYLDNI